MSKLKRLSAVIAAASVVIMVSASPAWAPRNLRLHDEVFGTCELADGTDLELKVGFDVDSFSTNRDGLTVVGDMVGGCFAPGESTPTVRIGLENAAFPIAITVATCSDFFFDLSPFEYENAAIDVTTEIQFFTYDPVLGDAKRVGARLCTVERNHEKWSPEQLARVLNAILFEEA